MRKVKIISLLMIGVLTISAGCEAPEKAEPTAGDKQQAAAKPAPKEAAPTKPAPAEPKPAESTPAKPAVAVVDNPTTRSGRGVPDLDSWGRPAAWVYVDGQEGRYVEKDGRPLIQWILDTPVSRTPTFRVEAYEPVLGTPKDFQCALQTYESSAGPPILYAIRAKEGTFEVGKEYSLIKPGDNFVIVDKKTDQVVETIPHLDPGTYGIAAGIKNSETGKEGLAVTYFIVGQPAPAPGETPAEQQPQPVPGQPPAELKPPPAPVETPAEQQP